MPTTTQAFETFAAWSFAHWLVIIAAVALCIAIVALRRVVGQVLDVVLAAVSALIWLAIQVAQLVSDDFSAGTALPLHLSDLILLAVPLALWTCWRWARAVLYCWGLALGTLAFVMPDLRDGPARLGFWTFWGGHVVILAGVVYEVAARGYRPAWSDVGRAAALATLYVLLIVPFNTITGHNYGYVGPDQPAQPAALKYIGPWPFRVAPLLLAGIAGMALVTLPWQFDALFRRHYNRQRPEEWQSGRMRRS